MKTKEVKTNRGITLIALVITIIVLLILAGVTIATLTGDNGILTKANEAKKETEIASVKEQAQLDIANWVSERLEKGEDTIVNTPDKVKEILENANTDNANKYYKGFTDTGVETPNGYEVSFEELYNNGSTISKTVDDLKAGEKVYYDTGNTSVGENGIVECIVLYDKTYNETNGTDYGIQIITSNVIDNNILDLDMGSVQDSYNNALKIFYIKAQDYLNNQYVTSARCSGSNPADPTWDTNENEAGNFSKKEGDEDYFEYMKPYYGVHKNEDEQYLEDWNQIKNINIQKSNDYYWLASRKIKTGSYSTNFYVRCVSASGNLDGDRYDDGLCWKRIKLGYETGRDSYGFRPVFTLKSEIKITNGDGVDTPYTLEV